MAISIYTLRNISFKPVRIGELVSLLQFAEGSEGLVGKESRKQRVENDVEMTCLQVEQGKVRGKTHRGLCEFYISRNLNDEWQEPLMSIVCELYNDYFGFKRLHRLSAQASAFSSGSQGDNSKRKLIWRQLPLTRQY